MEAGTVSELRCDVETPGSVAHLSAYFVSVSAAELSNDRRRAL